MLKYIFVVAKSTQKIVFLLTPAGIGDFKSVIRISPSYKNKTTKKKQSSCSYSKPFYHGKTIKQRVTAPLPWDIQPGFWTPRLKQHVLKHGKPNTPEHVNWITQTERKNEYFTDWVGVPGFCLFVCLFFFTLPIARLAGVFRVPFRCFRAYHVRGYEWGSLLNV